MDALPFYPNNSVLNSIQILHSWIWMSKLNLIWKPDYKGIRKLFSFLVSVVQEGNRNASVNFEKPSPPYLPYTPWSFDPRGETRI